jgi:hypothetical protein
LEGQKLLETVVVMLDDLCLALPVFLILGQVIYDPVNPCLDSAPEATRPMILFVWAVKHSMGSS